ncbi:TetR/AcrR family transcriptional regulator [Streptomyces sp. RKND-216]|uniref:TetR/AcrR family transcriptional regulator n=1 Tax=Streptomyces sp. RKND-216 TaxID=2562581 RepID=UPI001FFAC16A|nr:TetR/AcrR family transcriptional regulator [Streptomyces sp. RKND-216]
MDDMGETSGKTGHRAAYHHGDLRNALIDAATDLAREGGPDAVVLRAAARRVGVSPTAAYRHFNGQGDLLFAVKVCGQRRLAESMAAAGELGQDATGDEVEDAVLAMGRGYISFALREPGLFRSAFCDTPELAMVLNESGVPSPSSGEWQFRSFEMLIDVLDRLVACGRMPAHRRPGAEVAAWSMVHGLSVLLLDGPFAQLPDDRREAAVDRTLRTLLAGFTAP